MTEREKEARHRLSPHVTHDARAMILAGRDTLVRGDQAVAALEDVLTQRDLAIVELYKHDPKLAAAMCDDMFDKSGALLGRIREIVMGVIEA